MYSNVHNFQTVSLPYMLTSTPTVSTTSTVLPPVAHFLGHPSGHSHSPGGIVFPSLLPATHSVSTAETSAAVSLSSAAASGRGSHEMVEGSLSVGGESGGGGSARHDSLTNSSSSSSLITAWHPDAQLPERLPVPPYSEKVMKAKKTGVTKYERPLIIRETVLFFLSIKYWWSSVDYDRISDFVVEYFPDLKDPMLSPNMPPNVSWRCHWCCRALLLVNGVPCCACRLELCCFSCMITQLMSPVLASAASSWKA